MDSIYDLLKIQSSEKPRKPKKKKPPESFGSSATISSRQQVATVPPKISPARRKQCATKATLVGRAKTPGAIPTCTQKWTRVSKFTRSAPTGSMAPLTTFDQK